ncbi:MAG: hypothetical protein KUG82_17535 [Pseudomonadales bacterium]|nr:hypothetical protein [Pseudomonadales bacterium]
MGPDFFWTRFTLNLKYSKQFAILSAISFCLLFLTNCQSIQTPTSNAGQIKQQLDQNNINVLYQQIDEDIEAYRLRSPADNNALAKLSAIQELDPDNSQLIPYKDKIANRYLHLAEAAANRQKWEKAKRYLDHARDINKDLSAINSLQAVITTAQAEENIKVQITKLSNTPGNRNNASKTIATTHKQSSLAMATTNQTKVKQSPPRELIVKLNQQQINARSTFVSLSLDGASQQIIDKNATVIIFTQSQRDYRWLSALLKTSVYLIDSDFEIQSKSRIQKSSPPRLVIRPRR